jgi:hypothetical protein
MSGKKLFKALGATVVLLVVVVALANPKFLNYFKGALILFLEGDPNITFEHEELDEESEFTNVTPEYVTALDEAGIEIPEGGFDGNVTILKANDAIDVPANAPYKLGVAATEFDRGSDIIEVAAALVDSRIISPNMITGGCEDTPVRNVPSECTNDLLSIASGIDLLRYFSLRNSEGQDRYDILLPPLGINLASGQKSLVSSSSVKEGTGDSGVAKALSTSELTGDDSAWTGSQTSALTAATGIGFEQGVSLDPNDFASGGANVGFFTDNFGVNPDASVPRSLLVVSTNAPFTSKLMEGVKIASPLFSYDVEGFTEYDDYPNLKFGYDDLKITKGEDTEFSFVTNLESIGFKLTPVSKELEISDPTSLEITDGDIFGEPIKKNIVADEDGLVTLVWDGTCNYEIDDKVVQACDLEKHNYVYLDLIDEDEEVFRTYVLKIEFATENGVIVDLFALYELSMILAQNEV